MTTQWGKPCDGCSEINLVNYRHKCLRCTGYDLCHVCFENNVETGTHTRHHKNQLLLRNPSRHLMSEGEALSANTLVCPICGVAKNSVKGLKKHVTSMHNNIWTEVICPICVSKPSDNAVPIRDVANHIRVEHGSRSSTAPNGVSVVVQPLGFTYRRLTGRGPGYERIKVLGIICIGTSIYLQMYQRNRSPRIRYKLIICNRPAME